MAADAVEGATPTEFFEFDRGLIKVARSLQSIMASRDAFSSSLIFWRGGAPRGLISCEWAVLPGRSMIALILQARKNMRDRQFIWSPNACPQAWNAGNGLPPDYAPLKILGTISSKINRLIQSASCFL